MKFFWLFVGLLFMTVLPLCAQNWTSQDSLQLQRLLQQKGELELNLDALREMGVESPLQSPQSYQEKSWLDFKVDLPSVLQEKQQKVVLTLHPYSPGTPYNWDPIHQKKIKVDKNTWRGAFYDLKTRKYPSNWAKNPLDPGPRNSLEQIEATGLRYVAMERAHNVAVGEWRPVSRSSGGQVTGGSGASIGGLDLMTPFTRDFWNFRGRKARKRTLEVLRAYGDSTLVRQKR